MATKILKEDIDKLLLSGQEYTDEELHDVIKQLAIEKQNPNEVDFIIFRDKRYNVKKATFNTIRDIMSSPITRKFDANNFLQIKESRLNSIPFIWRIFEVYQTYHIKKTWKQFCELVFIGDVSGLDIGELTPEEVQRIVRIFFQFLAAFYPSALAERKDPLKDI